MLVKLIDELMMIENPIKIKNVAMRFVLNNDTHEQLNSSTHDIGYNYKVSDMHIEKSCLVRIILCGYPVNDYYCLNNT